jgi:agmatine deiminase
MSWPRPDGISFPGRYDSAIGDILRIVGQIARFEPVFINVGDAEQHVRARLDAELDRAVIGRVHLVPIPTNEPWCRDHGPAFVKRGDESAVVDWGFNAWGGKYPPWEDDDRVPSRVAARLGLRLFDAGEVVMEGGAVDFDGRGTILTTTDCLLNPNRNPHLSREAVETVLLDYYGQSRVLWLTGGIEGDDTDGHVDDLARFIDGRTIVVGVEPDPADPNHRVTQAAADQCRSLRDAEGRAYRVVELPMPPRLEIDGERLPATHVNFAFVNGGLLVPTFGGDSDDACLAILRNLLPGREVVGVDCREVIWGLGAIHCLTQPQPA